MPTPQALAMGAILSAFVSPAPGGGPAGPPGHARAIINGGGPRECSDQCWDLSRQADACGDDENGEIINARLCFSPCYETDAWNNLVTCANCAMEYRGSTPQQVVDSFAAIAQVCRSMGYEPQGTQTLGWTEGVTTTHLTTTTDVAPPAVPSTTLGGGGITTTPGPTGFTPQPLPSAASEAAGMAGAAGGTVAGTSTTAQPLTPNVGPTTAAETTPSGAKRTARWGAGVVGLVWLVWVFV